MKQSRPLTDGEIALARSMFGEAIDYQRVRIVRGKWWPFQHKGVVMAPTGNVHFHPDDPRLVGWVQVDDVVGAMAGDCVEDVFNEGAVRVDDR